MTAIAATTGTIRSRVDGTLVLALEIDPSQAQEAFRLFGTPGTQVAIAALKDGSFLAQSQHQPEADPMVPIDEAIRLAVRALSPVATPKIGDACLLACRWCADPQFWRWIEESGGGQELMPCNSEAEAKQFVCMVCGIKSRKDIDTDPAALNIWHQYIRKPYRDYLAVKGGA